MSERTSGFGLLARTCLPARCILSQPFPLTPDPRTLPLTPSQTNHDYCCYTTRCGHGNTKPLLASCVVALESAACRTHKVSATPLRGAVPCAARPNLPYIGLRHAAMEISLEGRCVACCVMRIGTSPLCREAFPLHAFAIGVQFVPFALRVGGKGKKKTTREALGVDVGVDGVVRVFMRFSPLLASSFPSPFCNTARRMEEVGLALLMCVPSCCAITSCFTTTLDIHKYILTLVDVHVHTISAKLEGQLASISPQSSRVRGLCTSSGCPKIVVSR